jgi:hypothetical protein
VARRPATAIIPQKARERFGGLLEASRAWGYCRGYRMRTLWKTPFIAKPDDSSGHPLQASLVV